MNKHIKKLSEISLKKSRIIIGLMSGTSLDGLDIAVCKIENTGINTKVNLLNFETVNYTPDFKEEVKSIFSKEIISLEKLCLLNNWIADIHSKMINDCLKKWGLNNSEIDLIASHGQTIFHAPKRIHKKEKFGNATLQIGDGDKIATKTGIITVSDFRQKNIAKGGEGAPLAYLGDFLLFAKNDLNQIILNIGGISNFTFIPKNSKLENIICTDIGPGNTIMDRYINSKFPNLFFDKNGDFARKGSVNYDLLNTLFDHNFFKQSFPKTTGPEIFNLEFLENAKRKSGANNISDEDTMATLNKFTAKSIYDSILKCIPTNENTIIYCSGGGAYNDLLISTLKENLINCTFKLTTEIGLNADAKEAILFAILANETIAGSEFIEGTEIKNEYLGKISLP